MINVNKWTKGAKRTYQHIHIPLCEHACVCMHTHAQTERDRDTEKISKSPSEPKSVKNTNPSCSLTLPEIWACAMSTALRTVSNTRRGLRKQLLKVSCVYFACTFEDLQKTFIILVKSPAAGCHPNLQKARACSIQMGLKTTGQGFLVESWTLNTFCWQSFQISTGNFLKEEGYSCTSFINAKLRCIGGLTWCIWMQYVEPYGTWF